ncbi:hypothetical protein CLIB1423_11S02586 [[Candida] railenensis]|uniref:Uncharacterized protein n=1 Tax=[Candida] railenensis TaxID=45579 RepID=A0A9P0VZ12_9ASCO|nr:hypothetical protein CLIB1423_11S02586 [[Candida] railenensis]
MSVYENGSSFFLLQTENFEPLLKLIDSLNHKIAENQDIIDRLTKVIDHKFDYPDIDKRIEEIKTPAAEHEDILSLFLQEKYKLDQIRIPSDVGRSEVPRVAQLRKDIARLKILRDSNSAKNQQLFQIIQDYEMFIVSDVLPKMREDIERYRAQSFSDIKLRQLDEKTSAESKLWSNYTLYVEQLNRLIIACEKLSNLMEEEIDGEEIRILEQKLRVIHQIRSYLTEGRV